MSKIQVSFKNYTTRQKIAEYTILLFLSTIFLLLFSLWTSPYYKEWYGCDASFFTLVGRGITEGKIMYRDFYDLKGPYFFFIQTVGQFIFKGRFGAFIIQLIALYASVVLIWNISLLFVNKAKSSFILAVFFACHIATLWGGNTLEEFFLPFSLLALYLACLLLKSAPQNYRSESADLIKKFHIPSYFSIMLGLFLGFMIFSKISIAGTILGIIGGFIFILMSGKKYNQAFLFIIYILLGILIAALPVILYYTYQGCLMDMLKCVFIVGFRRSKDYGEAFNLTWELKCSGVVFAFLFAVTHIKKSHRNICVVLLAASCATYIFLHLGTPYYYYFTSVYPCLILALALFLERYEPLFLFENPRQAACLIAFAIYLLYYIPVSLGTVRTAMYDRKDTSYAEYKQNCTDIAAMIPDFEKDQVFSFLIDMQFYEINDMMPCNRFVVNLPFFIALDPDVLPELTEFMYNTPPKWVVVGDYLEFNIPDMYEYLETRYSCIYENEVGKLYLLN